MTEQRTVLRATTSLKGEIVAGDDTLVACVVLNLTGNGAKLNVVESARLPRTFWLRASDLNLNVQAKLVWRKGEEAGVRFPLVATQVQSDDM